ncbi:kinesin-like protein KIN-14R [Musa acuminata AAA Group]|uniref:kinesin-like protein KIN-14R n=1 Tax=Musa acuminata AAA Group TaxID=214697 RepID=UPI0031DD5370
MADDFGGQAFEFQAISPQQLAGSPSPGIFREGIQESPDYIRETPQRNKVAPVELFPGSRFDGFTSDSRTELRTAEACPEKDRKLDKDGAFEASIELGVIPEIQERSLRINAGCVDEFVVCGGIEFELDRFYSGGDPVKTDAVVGDGTPELYQSARFGNFSYQFPELEAGDYLVDLHFAEIVFTEGPAGTRVFDVRIQEDKVVAGLDIYARVGSNRPLVLSDLRASVVHEQGLSIRFEGVVGHAIVSGISIRQDFSAGETIKRTPGKQKEVSDRGLEECVKCSKLEEDYQLLITEQTECRRALENLKRDNELKNKECHEARLLLQKLQMELMQKSMHVGSLAFAIEGQVKEKSRWFQSLANLSEKFHLLKLEHVNLSGEALEFKRCLVDISHATTIIQTSLDRHVNLEKEIEDLKLRFNEESKEKKDLYNKVIELKGNIRVFCRCRPLNTEEKTGGASMVVDFESANDGELIVKGHVSSSKAFKFDSVFSPEDDQETVFQKTAPFATSVLDGYNVCIFAYGQTGTGKTFTMEGNEEARGVNYRTLEEIFRIIRERQGLYHYEVTVSVLEVYNEQIHDLLLSGSQPTAAAKKLEVRQVTEGVHHVPGLVEAHVTNMTEAWEVLQTGSKARVVGSTNANEHSSRSHCIHCVMIRGENLVNGECTRSKLWLIDLAGSERVAKTDAQGERLKEAQNINKSLSALGNVISALATKSPHVPFRNSKLTHLLQDSLGGDSKTLMFVQISPNEDDVGETLCSLNFASRVRGIELGPAKRQIDMSEIFRYKQLVGKVKEDSKLKDSQMKKMEETIQSLEIKNKAKDMINKNLQDKVKELESQLLIERKLARQHVDNRIAENQLQQLQQQQRREQHEENISSAKSFLVTRPPIEKIHTHIIEKETCKEFADMMRPLADNNCNRPLLQSPNDHIIFKNFLQFRDKENKPEIAEEPFPRKASRVSLCPTIRGGLPVTTAPRRNSLIPLPMAKALINAMDNLSPPLPSQAQPTLTTVGACEGETRSQQRSAKKINSILRRSLQKKVIIRPQLPQAIRRGGTLSGLDKLRLSVGRSGRKARRMVLGNAGDGDRVMQQKQKKEKERGWNHGATTARTIF